MFHFLKSIFKNRFAPLFQKWKMDLINKIIWKWKNNKGVSTVEASVEIMEAYMNNPKLFNDNGITLDQYGVLKKQDDLRIHYLGNDNCINNEYFDDSEVNGNEIEEFDNIIEDADPENPNNDPQDPAADNPKIGKRTAIGEYNENNERGILTGKGIDKIEIKLGDTVTALKNIKPGLPKRDGLDAQIPTRNDIQWTAVKDTRAGVGRNPTEDDNKHVPGLDELEKFLKEEDSENQEKALEQDRVITEEEKAILKSVKLKYSDELLPYQINHVKKLVAGLKEYTNAFDGSETGTGKTHSALVTAKNLGYNVVVICPKPVIYTWYDAMKLHKFKVCDSMKEAKKVKRWGFVSNYEQFKNGNTSFLKTKLVEGDKEYRWNKFPEKTLLIVDEIQKAKNYKTKNAEMLFQARIAGVPILLLSATAVDKVAFMYPIGFMLDLYRSVVHFKQWVRTKKIEAPSEMIPEKYCMTVLHKHIFPKRGSRMTIKDAGDSFPKNYVIWEPYVNKKIKEVFRLFEKRIKKMMAAKGESECMLTAILRARQETELLKVPILIEMAQDLMAEGKSVAIFLNFKESIEYVALALKTDCIIWGDNTTEEREKFRKRFVKNKEKVIICNIASGGVGISLHDTSEGGAHPRVSLINPTWSAQDIKQTLGRIFRSGATSKCIQKIIYAPGTVEEKLMEVVKFKLNNIEILNDGPVNMLKEVFEVGVAPPRPAKSKRVEKNAEKDKKSKKVEQKTKNDKKSKKDESSSSSDKSDEESGSIFDFGESSDEDVESSGDESVESSDDEEIESSEDEDVESSEESPKEVKKSKKEVKKVKEEKTIEIQKKKKIVNIIEDDD